MVWPSGNEQQVDGYPAAVAAAQELVYEATSTGHTVTGLASLTVTSVGDGQNPDRQDTVTCSITDEATGKNLARNVAGPASDATVRCMVGTPDA